MNAIVWLTSGLGFGWVLGRLFDPSRGRRRRALIRDRVVSATHTLGGAVETTSRDLGNRTRGVIADLRGRLFRHAVSDPVLVERVRTRIGRSIRHPRAIDVTARDSRVIVRGHVTADEAGVLLRRVASVRGVREVEDRLEIHAVPSEAPGLPGRRQPRRVARPDVLQARWSPTTRLLVGLAGSGFAVLAGRRGGVGGMVAGAGSLAMLARALTNLELGRLVGIGAHRRAVTVQKTLTVAAPIEEVFDFWSRYENFPRFMAHVRAVQRSGEGRGRWTIAGPAGVPIEWETVETRHEPPTLLAWTTVEGAPVAHTGVVRFEPEPGGTRIHIQMHYNPPAGALGHALAALLGADPKRALDEDLIRFKSLLEDGKTSVRGQTVGREAIG
jgi:uncharacterized membrane protein